MLEYYIADLKKKLTKQLLDDGTLIFCLNDIKIIELYKPLTLQEIAQLELELSELSEAYKRCELYFPTEYAKFLYEANGLNCFHSAFTLSGKQTLDRTNFELNSPFSLMDDNRIRPYAIPKDFIGIGSYGYNLSSIFLDPKGKVYIYDGEIQKFLLQKGGYKKYLDADVKLLAKFETLNEFLIKETNRLLEIYLKNPWNAFNKGVKTLPSNINTIRKKHLKLKET